MGRCLIFLFCIGITFSASSQMTDLLGNLAIQSQMSAQGVKGYNTVNLINQKNNLAQELQIQLIDLQTKSLNKTNNVSRETITSPILKKYNTTVQKIDNLFCFKLHNVEKELCKNLTIGFAGSYKIDNSNCQNLQICYK